eukprot:TRINITY_DN21486_c3_g1_i1.p1 TRINITY_DN21486_c3_g1~~TRINITY_DN21486_c3_g1_i1.p1  ORF type:complete len:119 (+),score=24.97 TRINITY_DN21486_c3_g1_i1:85-441(+)
MSRPPLPDKPQCDHNAWDKLRVRGDSWILQCRMCPSKFKNSQKNITDKQCSQFAMTERCDAGASCSMLHLYKNDKKAKEKAEEVRGSGSASGGSGGGSGESDDSVDSVVKAVVNEVLL